MALLLKVGIRQNKLGKLASSIFCIFLMAVLLQQTFLCQPAAARPWAKPSPVFQVLIVHSAYQGYPWTDDLNRGIHDVFDAAPESTELIIEYIDVKRNHEKSYFEKLHELWQLKYRDWPIDLILVCDNEAYDFIVNGRDKLFQGIPLVFAGFNGFHPSILKGKERITGVVERTDIKATIDVALHLHPETKKVVFVVPGAPPFRMVWLDGLPDHYKGRVELINITAANLLEIDRELHSLGSDIIIIPLNSVRYEDSTYMRFDKFVSHLSVNNKFPVYALWDIALGKGCVGGRMVTGELQGQESSKLALQILRGTPVSALPVVENSPNQYMFDWSQLQRFKIDPERLPGGSVVINRPVSFYMENRGIVHATVGAIFFLLLLIFLLIVAVLNFKRTEKELRKSETRFRTMIKKSPLPMVITDQNQDISLFNDKFTELFGYTLEDVSTAEKWWEIAYPDEEYRAKVQQSWIMAIDKASANNTDIEMQSWDLTIKDGGKRSCEFYMVPLDEFSLIIMNDVTQRKATETDLKLQALAMDNSSDTIVLTDRRGNINYVNPAFEKISGYSREEVLGKNLSILKSEVHDSLFYENLWTHLSKGEVWSGNFINKRKDGSLYTEEATISPVFSGKNEIINYVAVKRDISERLQLEDRLRQAQKMESIGVLAGGIAHDFNNILSAIIGFTELALDQAQKGSGLEDDLREILAGGKRAKDLVKQILTFARQSDETLKPIRVDVIVKEVLKFIRSSIPASIEINSDIQSTSLIKGDSIHIHQIFMNLCTNAAYAMEKEGGVLNISLHDGKINKDDEKAIGLPAGRYLEIKISDTGTGIPADIIGNIFEPYFTTKAVEDGTGMGLAVVHGIVESYGGKIMVNSKLNQGSIFTIYFPIIKENSVEIMHEPEVLPMGSERILFVDDEISITKIGSRVLSRLGYRVTTMNSSKDALALFQARPDDFDLVISDMTMPNMTGDILAANLMKIRPDIPVVLCTGYSRIMSKETSAQLGIKAFISKPIKKEDFARTLRKVLDETRDSGHA